MNQIPKSNTAGASSTPAPVVIHQVPPPRRWLLRFLLVVSVLFNIGMYAAYQEYFAAADGPQERYYSGDKSAGKKIAVINIAGTIMPPFTSRILQAIERATDDSDVQGVVLSIDSPGGLVADSHQIYHLLAELRKKKPIVVSMQRMAASGGYYVAMGAGPEGRIFAEPTTWTGSIGVIIPRFDLSKMADQIGIISDPLKTGAFKDALSPFRELTAEERELWEEILDESFQRFLSVIADNRSNFELDQVRELATGQIYTATDAFQNGLVDEIGYEEDAIEFLKLKLGLDKVRVVSYQSEPQLLDLLTGSMQAKQPENQWQRLLEATVPRALYYCSWSPFVSGS